MRIQVTRIVGKPEAAAAHTDFGSLHLMSTLRITMAETAYYCKISVSVNHDIIVILPIDGEPLRNRVPCWDDECRVISDTL